MRSDSPQLASGEAKRIKILNCFPQFTVYRSTDRRYLYTQWVRLAHSYPLDILPNKALWPNLAHAADYLAARLHLKKFPLSVIIPPNANADVAFAYGYYPDRKPDCPLVFEQNFAPTVLGEKESEWMIRTKNDRRVAVTMADQIITSTRASEEYFLRLFPEHAHKLKRISYYFRHIEPISDQKVVEKYSDTKILKMLFVGREAHRKGLDTILAGIEKLPPAYRKRIQLTVVSDMLDGKISLPSGTVHHPYLNYEPHLKALFESSHVHLFPTKREAFGLVLAEAMAAGCAILTTTGVIQRSIVPEKGGEFIDPTSAEDAARSLKTLIDRGPELIHLARENVRGFRSEFYHREVGDRYFRMFQNLAK